MSLLQAIQDDFVEMRKTDHKSMTVEDFHTLLNLVRYVYVMLFTFMKINYYWSKFTRIWVFVFCILRKKSWSNSTSVCSLYFNRLLSLSALETSPTQSMWEKAKSMESERKRRILTANSSQWWRENSTHTGNTKARRN